MNQGCIRPAIESCRASDRILNEAEQIVATVINNTLKGTLQTEQLTQLLRKFRDLAQEEGISLGDMTDLDLYMSVVRTVAGCTN